MDLVTLGKISLLVFIAAGIIVLAVSAVFRWRARRAAPDLREPFEARYGTTMAGNWTPAIEDNRGIVAEKQVDDPDRSGRLSGE